MLGTLERPGLVGWNAHNDRYVVCPTTASRSKQRSMIRSTHLSATQPTPHAARLTYEEPPMHRLLFRPTLFALVLSAAACDDAATNAIAPSAARPSFGMFNAEAPVPVLVSAVRSGGNVTITFMDDAVDETLVSAYFTGGADFAVT